MEFAVRAVDKLTISSHGPERRHESSLQYGQDKLTLQAEAGKTPNSECFSHMTTARPDEKNMTERGQLVMVDESLEINVPGQLTHHGTPPSTKFADQKCQEAVIGGPHSSVFP